MLELQEFEPSDESATSLLRNNNNVRRKSVNLRKIREELSPSFLGLHHNVPHLFVTSQWQQPNRMSCLFLGYRIFWGLYFLMWGIWSWVGSMGYDAPLHMKKYYPTYMTNWGLWTLVIDTNLQTVNAILHFRKLAEEGDQRYQQMKKLTKVSWLLSNVTSTVHLFITSAYWVTVYPMRTDEVVTEIGINTHLMPAIYVLIDSAVSATPRRLLHAYQPMGFIVTYTMFNLVYYLAGGLDYTGRVSLYPILDWTKPLQTTMIMAAVIFLLIPLLHSLVCGLFALRIKLWRILKLSRYTREEDEQKIENENVPV